MASAADAEKLKSANNEFTVALYQAYFPKAESQNLAFSPYGLNTLLGVIGSGARGNTRNEIFSSLKLSQRLSLRLTADMKDDDAIGNFFGPVLSNIKGASTPQTFMFLTANRVYCQSGLPLNPAFVKRCKDKFAIEVEQLDFVAAAACATAVATINQWVDTNTQNKIKNIVSTDTIAPLSRIIAVSGIYVKGLWERKFDPAKTVKQEFKLGKGKKVEVEMMQIKFKFPSAEMEGLAAEAVALPFKGGRFHMVIILPNSVSGLSKFETSIDTLLQGGKSLVKGQLTTDDEMEVKLPKFKIEGPVGNLKQVLETIGMKTMFNSSGADFGGMTDQKGSGLYVSTVIQKLLIEVNEEGADVPAPTGKSKSGVPFVVDHPFYFQIVDSNNGDLVLFSGHVTNPTVTTTAVSK